MELLKRSEEWRDTHQNSRIILVLRVVLGLILLYKGIYFLIHSQEVASLVDRSKFGSFGLVHYIALVHLAGGLMIASGFLTRVSVLFQLPILIGAVFFINAPRSMFHIYSEWILSVAVLLMLLFFLFYGPGIYSMDVYLRKKRFYE